MLAAHRADDGRIQPLEEHLRHTAEAAGAFAAPFFAGAAAWGYALGLGHDLGKASAPAQRRILADGPRVDHTTAGAQLYYRQDASLGFIMAHCIAGHHTGLQDTGDASAPAEGRGLLSRMKRPIDERWPNQPGMIPDYRSLELDLPIPPPGKIRSRMGDCFSLAFLIRMLYSCLVDADYLDTETFMTGGGAKRGGFADLGTLFARFCRATEDYHRPNKDLDRLRCWLLENCLDKATLPPGLFTLTVPTGGGKTAASLGFALRHALEQGKRRVIYVTPHTSIIDEHAERFSQWLGRENLVEHHGMARYDDEEERPVGPEDDGEDRDRSARRLATENWDTPVILTTTAQFFESLFGARASQCRKLHNIANSVVIFDEVQMIPPPVLKPCVRAIEELVKQYGCTAVLCTATQPALDKLFRRGRYRLGVTELSEDIPALYEKLLRVRCRWLGQMDDGPLAQRLLAHEQALCIVNNRRHALELYELLGRGEGCYHLTTLMHPQHRKRVLDEIQGRLAAGRTCRVVSSSLVEAGVDLDFPAVYRANADLDSLIQAAGRCNREGTRPLAESWLYVFDPQQGHGVPGRVQRREGATASMQHKLREALNTMAPAAIRQYFNQLYLLEGEGLDKLRVLDMLDEPYTRFEEVAERFRHIDSPAVPVFVPLGEYQAEGDDLAGMERLVRQPLRSRELLRDVYRYCVAVYPRDIKRLLEAGAVEAVDDSLFILIQPGAYDPETGLARALEGGAGDVA